MEEWLAVIADTSKWSSQTHNQTGSLYKDQKEQWEDGILMLFYLGFKQTLKKKNIAFKQLKQVSRDQQRCLANIKVC